MDIILGYMNPNPYLPAPITVVFQRGKDLLIRYPALTEYGINSSVLEQLVRDDELMPENKKRILKDGEYAFAFDKQNIMVGAHDEIVRAIAKKLEIGVLDGDKEMLFNYINNSVPNSKFAN